MSAGLWRWLGRAEPDRGPFEREMRRRGLAGALRTGHALGARWSLSIRSGVPAAVDFRTEDPPSARWLVRVLAPALGEHAGRPVAEAPPAGPPEVLAHGRRLRSWPHPLRGPEDALSLADSVAAAFAAVRPGTRVVLRFASAPLASIPAPPDEPVSVERRGRSPVARPNVPRPPTSTVFWQCAFTMERDTWDEPTADVEPSVRAVESACRSTGGNGISISRRHRWAFPVPAFEVAEEELVDFLPGTTGTLGPGASGIAQGTSVLLPIGRTSDGRVVGTRIEPGQGRHLAVLGETGMGKSSLLVSLARRAAAGAGLIFFDPIGDSARRLLAELGGAERARVVFISPERAHGINALEGAHAAAGEDPARADRHLSDLVHSLRRVRAGRYADSSFWGPRLEEMLTRALAAAAAYPDGTLADAHRLLSTAGRGFRVAPAEAIPLLGELADRIRTRPDDAEGARRLLYEVARNPTLVRTLCDPRGDLTAERLVRPGAVVLVSGDAALAGETTARYLLSVYLALAWSALLSRGPSGKTFVVLDEAQWFAHESLAEMLRLGRRGNLHVVLATQSLGAMPEPVAESVWTNVADFVAFRGSPEEAREFARGFSGVDARALLSLPRGEAAVFLGKGGSVHWVRTVRIPDRVPAATSGPLLPEDSGRRVGEDAVSSPEESLRPDGSGPALERVLEEIAARADGWREGVPVRIDLAELRRRADPDGEAVRIAGTLLRRSGALVRSGRSPRGSVWWVDPARLPNAPPAGAPNGETAGPDEA